MLEFGGDIHAGMSRRGIPFSAGLELTAKCNLDCRHCYHVHASGPEMLFPELRRVLDELAGLGVFELTFTGGEPISRPDFFDILEYAVNEKGFSVKIFSNLTLLDTPKADRLARIPLNCVETTLLGHEAALHDSLTRRPGSFDAVIAGIRLLLERGIRVRAKTMVMKPNHHALSGIARLAERLGVPFRYDDGIFVESDGGRSPLALQIPEHEMRRDRKRRGYRSEKSAPAVCNASRTMLHIAPDGAVFPCGPFPVPAGNIREMSLREIWRNAPLVTRLRSLRDEDYRVCRNCRYLFRCGGCLAMGWGLSRGRIFPCRMARKILRPFI